MLYISYTQHIYTSYTHHIHIIYTHHIHNIYRTYEYNTFIQLLRDVLLFATGSETRMVSCYR